MRNPSARERAEQLMCVPVGVVERAILAAEAVARAEGRREGLEAAAKIVDGFSNLMIAPQFAAAIREAMKEKKA